MANNNKKNKCSKSGATGTTGTSGTAAASPANTRVVIAATHPQQFNGYSKVVYELSRRLALDPRGVELHLFGFQNVDAGRAPHRPGMPEQVTVYDAMANEDPKKQGFGADQVVGYCERVKPDVFVVYNDMVVVSSILEKLAEARRSRDFRVVAYVDQVYEHQKRVFVKALNATADACVAFTPYWAEVLRKEGVVVPIHHVRHGFDRDTHFPCPKNLARMYYGIPESDFVVLNLNRNQPRKRWDTCMKAWAHLVSTRGGGGAAADAANRRTGFKLVVGTAVHGAWNILEVYERELAKRGVDLKTGLNHLIFINSPQRLTDKMVNILMNAADVGINTADGEGFGLCTFEHAGIGRAQVVPRVGGFRDYLDDECATLIEPAMNYYVDSARDLVGGEAEMCDYGDFADALEAYMDDPGLAERHGRESRAKIVGGSDGAYSWDALAQKMGTVVLECRSRRDRPEATDRTTAEAADTTEAYKDKKDNEEDEEEDQGVDASQARIRDLEAKLAQLTEEVMTLSKK